ncbi:sulfite exporter TauE/SafE family protein [Rhodoferax sp.]|uniref:sulfite exporter TauE/SafE family protein n=1 Tax=Rhodoferax sp. TaxID=50421 RepID=UPI0025FFA809|nr:sulfite exporter TauE/SafE family protein [Rhodoferax sp.]
MQSSLAVTALLMGLVGGPHCVAMCGAACAGIGRAAGNQRHGALWSFQAGRVVGYSALGGLAAASVQGLGWLTVQSAALRPLWSLLHVVAIVLGLVLLWSGRQPLWLQAGARSVWQAVRRVSGRRGLAAPASLGVMWALLPCGLLYSALLLASLAGDVMSGAMVMALFALGTSVAMMAGPWLWLRLSLARLGDGQWGIRLAGAALSAASGWALWMGLVHNQAPWCITA